jgi:hypothetical protein
MSKCRGGIDETEGFQPLLSRGGSESRLLGRQPRDRVEQRPVEQLLVQPAYLAGMRLVRMLPGVDIAKAHCPRESAQLGRAGRQQVRTTQLHKL